MDKKPSHVSAFRISQATRATFTDLYFQSTFLFFIQNGSKRIIDSNGKELIGKKGDLLVCGSGSELTIQNSPKLDSEYKALCISFNDDLISRVFHNKANDPSTSLIQLVNSKEHSTHSILSIILETLESEESLPPEIFENRLIEPLIWLKHRGYNIEIKKNVPLLQVRQLIETDLTHPWCSKSVAKHFAMSEATMRRWLSKTGLRFSKILLNARLESGLSLLQTTDMQVIQIALASGFKSSSHFSEAFKQRFGITPKEIRKPKE